MRKGMIEEVEGAAVAPAATPDAAATGGASPDDQFYEWRYIDSGWNAVDESRSMQLRIITLRS